MSNEVTPWIDCDDGSCVRLLDGEILADVYEEDGCWWGSYQTGEEMIGMPLMATEEVESKEEGKKFCDEALGL